MSIPLAKDNSKDSINTSIIAIKRNIERINMLLGLVDSGSDPDLSGLATKQELQDAITELSPVDEVTVDNMHSVTSNAVYQSFKGMSVVECGKITGREQYDDSWYIKYDSGIIEEWWVQSSVIPAFTGSPIAKAEFNVTYPIPLKTGTRALQFDVYNVSRYGATGSLWFGTQNGFTDTNAKKSVSAYSDYQYNALSDNVQFHVVGFWK